MQRKTAPPRPGSNDAPARPAPRGRPRDPARRARLLAAAKELFGVHGLDGTSLDRIAQAAQVSKVTLYSYFESKEALFNATITQPFHQTMEVDLPTLATADPRAALRQMAQTYAAQVVEPPLIAHMRMLCASSARNADLARQFFDSGPGAMTAALVGFLRRANAAGTLRIADVGAAAEQFVSMVRGQDQLRALMGLPVAHVGRARTKYVDACVAAFVAAYAP